MDYQKKYEEKLTTAEAAAAAVQSGDWVEFGYCTTTPVAFDKALAKRLPELHDVNLEGGVLLHEPEVFKIEQPAEHFTWNSIHMGGIDRRRIGDGFVFYVPIRYSELPYYIRERRQGINVAVFQVAPMDKHGYFNLGPATSHAMAAIARADKVIVEVNPRMPIVLGGYDTCVHIDQVDRIIETEGRPLDIIPAGGEPSEVDRKVAEMVVREIPDGACLQLGIGGMPNTIGRMIAESDLTDLGIHTEMYVDSFVDMTEAGKITGSKKELNPGRQVFAFAAGTQRMYDFLDNNPACMAAPVDYVNDIATISAHSNFISINNAIEVDLYGQINAESAGIRNISGAGGQLDFVMGAYLSKGGKSFICLSSSYKNKKTGELESRIRPTLAPGSIVTDTRANGMYIVTEYGMANLKGLATWQRAEALIGLAHPDTRDKLIAEAENMHIWRRSNRR